MVSRIKDRMRQNSEGLSPSKKEPLDSSDAFVAKNGNRQKILSVNFFVKTTSNRFAQKPDTQQKASGETSVHNNSATIETWDLSFEAFDDKDFNEVALVNCFESIYQTIDTRSKRMPSFEYFDNGNHKFEEHKCRFGFKIQVHEPVDQIDDFQFSSSSAITLLKHKQKKAEFKFGLTFGKIIFEINFIPLK